jgi:multidrug resistance efflux pump
MKIIFVALVLMSVEALVLSSSVYSEPSTAQRIVAKGDVEPLAVVDIRPQITGVVKELGDDLTHPGRTVDVGTKVEKGSILAELDSTAMKRGLDQCTIRSPVSGTIISRRCNLGQGVSPNGEAMFVVADDSQGFQVWAHVPEADIVHLTKGQPARITTHGKPAQSVAGKVARITPDVASNNGVKTSTVAINLDDQDSLAPYQAVDVEIGMEAAK